MKYTTDQLSAMAHSFFYRWKNGELECVEIVNTLARRFNLSHMEVWHEIGKLR